MIGHLDWVDLAWPMMAAACLTLAAIHFASWLLQRQRWDHLMFVGAALCVAAISAFELSLMHATSLAEAISWQRTAHVPTSLLGIFLAGFIYFHFRSNRGALLLAVSLSRLVTMGVALFRPSGVNYQRVVALHRVTLPGGVEVSVIEGVASRWNVVTVGGWFLLSAIVLEAAYATWRHGSGESRARTLRVGGALAAVMILAPLHGWLIHSGVLRTPYLITPIFCLAVLAMAAEVTTDIVRASQLAVELNVSEERLQQSQLDRDLSIEAADLATWSLDLATLEIEGSGRFRELWGLAPGTRLTTEGALELVHVEDRAGLRAAVERAMTTEQPVIHEFRILTAGGEQRWLRGRGRLIVDAATDAPARIIRGVCYNVSDRRLAEERFRRIVDAAPSALLVVDGGGRIVFANQRAGEAFGYSLAELERLRIEQLMPAAARERHRAYRERYMAEPKVRPMGAGLELLGLRQDGSEFPCEISLAPFPDHAQGLVLAIVTDITARRQAELIATRQRAELTHLSRVAVLGELSASLAHEINQPLTAILSNAEAARRYLDRDSVDLEQVREIVDDIISDDQRAGEVIRRLRAMLRKEEVPHVDLDLNAAIHGVLRIMHSELVNRGVVVETSLSATLPLISADPVQMQQVLLNLLVNACDAMADRPRPRVLTVRTFDRDGVVWTEIGDRGSGIPEADLERIFEPFVTSKQLGTGLGLSVCRTLVHTHGGRIWASNNPAGGATLTVVLPVASRATGVAVY
jgi:PAS domain S-box-containing protein